MCSRTPWVVTQPSSSAYVSLTCLSQVAVGGAAVAAVGTSSASSMLPAPAAASAADVFPVVIGPLSWSLGADTVVGSRDTAVTSSGCLEAQQGRRDDEARRSARSHADVTHST